MNHESPTEPSRERSEGELLEKASGRWDAQRRAAAAQRDIPRRAPRAFTIALSREAGTRGTLVAEEVGKLLGWHVYDHELLERIAHDMGVRSTLLKSVDERQQSWLLETVQAFGTAPAKSEWDPPVSESAYVHHLVETVLALGVHGECVVVDRGAGFILPAETTLRVRLVAPAKDRAVVLAGRLGLSAQEAAHRLGTIDRERTDFVQDHFFRDAADPHNYDLVLNASRFSVAQGAELIIEGLHRLQGRGTGEGGLRPSL